LFSTNKFCPKRRIFKPDFKFEEYFNILDEQNSLLLCKFRITNHKLPIEKGRWSNIPRENRYCELCQKNQIGDEYTGLTMFVLYFVLATRCF
jgi:hypothetical protein